MRRYRPPVLHVGDLVRKRRGSQWVGRVVRFEARWDGMLLPVVQPTLTRWGGVQGKHVKARRVHPLDLELLEATPLPGRRLP